MILISFDVGSVNRGLVVLELIEEKNNIKENTLNINEKHTLDLRPKALVGKKNKYISLQRIFDYFNNFVYGEIFSKIIDKYPRIDLVLIENQPSKWATNVKSCSVLYTLLKKRFENISETKIELISATKKLSFIPINEQVKLLRSDTQRRIRTQKKIKLNRNHRKSISKKACEKYFCCKFTHDEADATLQSCAFLISEKKWIPDQFLVCVTKI